jgi:mannosyltransferase OCH1-like enzyme
MIPKKIHFVWVGGPLPAAQVRYIQTWKDQNPDYELVHWSESNIDFSVSAIRTAHKQKRWSKVADIVRLMAVHEQGGIYLDTDFELRKPLDPLLRHNSFWAFQCTHHPTDWVSNGVFGAEPGNWLVKEALDEVMKMRPVPFGLERPTRTGPKLITSLLKKHGLREYDQKGVNVRDIHICPTPVFFPFAMDEEFSEACIAEETLGIHFWEHSWAKDIPFAIRMAYSVKRRLRAAL